MSRSVRDPIRDLDALREELEAQARGHGFDRVGFARVAPLDREAAALRRWLAEGHHASMTWMERGVEVRVAPDHDELLPHARTVMVLAASVLRPGEEPVGPSPGVVARYARGRDYHNVLGTRAKKLAAFLRKQGHPSRATIDTMPLLERAWAQRAGVGFVGKNAMLIVPGLGSHVMLATVVTTAALRADEPMDERCGACTRCLEGCPTRAIVADRVIDARACLSYLTIEHEGAIDPALREPLGAWFLGCDACQDVCPFNRGHTQPGPLARELAPDPRWQAHDATSILGMSEQDFDAFSLGSPVRRPGLEGAARNAAYVLGNRGDRRHLPVLREAAATHASETVRDAARWAIERVLARE
ncbi:MAG: tRNA epoxyqueuosine(34) reductase QueG [Sandaracinaceae bacterium]|nr:tRNA epoxyqueuosine(34) reductase QueG [Sandaracinaceae bacterium]